MFKELKISTRINILLGILIAGIVILSVFGLWSSSVTKKNFDDTVLTNNNIDTLNIAVLDVTGATSQVNAAMLSTMLNQPVDEAALNDVKDLLADAKEKTDLFMSTPFKSEEEKIIANKIQREMTSVLVNTQEKIKYIKDPAHYPNNVLNDVKVRIELKKQANAYLDQAAALIDTYNQASHRDSRLMMMLSIISLLVVVICAIGTHMRLKALLVRRLKQANAAFRTIASGNLSEEIKTGALDEVGLMLVEAEKMRQSLTNTVYGIRSGVEHIHFNAQEIASNNSELSTRTEEQASALQQTAASMEELKITVRQNADHAHSAQQLAESASASAQKGGEVMSNLGKIMSEITVNSRQIADINSVIDGIANQTNILALNAAVEAARAGEQGRGFAVVAGEVRNLAKRSADAAKEIRQLINTCVANMDTGSQEVELAESSMQKIVASIIQVTNIMGEIASASDEQSVGINQIAQAVNEMDQVTQRNARMVEGAAKTASSVEEHASNLNQMVAEFVLNENHLSARSREQSRSRPAMAARELTSVNKREEEWSTF